jgi:ABC-type transport system involved in cytochrome c biogenesis permease subunit
MDFLGLDEYGLRVLSVFLLMIPTAFYILGLLEGRKGHYLFLTGLLLHALSIGHRWLLLGRVPLAEKHDNISFMAFSMALIYLYFSRRKGMRGLGVTALPFIAAFMFVALGFRQVNTVSPFMDTPWFYLHVFFYFLSYGFFGISACIGLHYIISNNSEYELLQYWGVIHGWIMVSLALFAGSVWFYIAYGTYWLWTSKELWITITWLYYGLYLHARLIRGMKGRFAGVMGILGFAVALFTYFGVGTIIKAPPSQF